MNMILPGPFPLIIGDHASDDKWHQIPVQVVLGTCSSSAQVQGVISAQGMTNIKFRSKILEDLPWNPYNQNSLMARDHSCIWNPVSRSGRLGANFPRLGPCLPPCSQAMASWEQEHLLYSALSNLGAISSALPSPNILLFSFALCPLPGKAALREGSTVV
jgi:hypothetical protein